MYQNARCTCKEGTCVTIVFADQTWLKVATQIQTQIKRKWMQRLRGRSRLAPPWFQRQPRWRGTGIVTLHFHFFLTSSSSSSPHQTRVKIQQQKTASGPIPLKDSIASQSTFQRHSIGFSASLSLFLPLSYTSLLLHWELAVFILTYWKPWNAILRTLAQLSL